MAVLVGAVLLAGLFFHVVAGVGVLRLPDFYTRLHALSKADTMGTLLVLSAVALAEGASLTAVKVIFIAVFFFLGNPAAAHAIARAARRAGLAPWRAGREAGR
ncbi:MAG TPA: monovalent cation/H(+) antiporter subunit G [Candidatus Limnocylindria bacterium]|nr:monovalent cation/H(+) antiporter subunit G [Candidatus Limnocylindria bacterium]